MSDDWKHSIIWLDQSDAKDRGPQLSAVRQLGGARGSRGPPFCMGAQYNGRVRYDGTLVSTFQVPVDGDGGCPRQGAFELNVRVCVAESPGQGL